jgi:hypothetical protein
LADLKIPIAIVAAQAPDLLERWLTTRATVPSELMLFEGAVPNWLTEHCRQHQINVQAVHAGCLCCLGGPVLKTELIRAVRKYQPLQVIIVTGIKASLSAVADALQTPMLETRFQLNQLFWLAGFEQHDPNTTKTELTKRELDNMAACSRFVLPNCVGANTGGHSKASEFVDSLVLSVWDPLIRFNRQRVLDSLIETEWPSNLTFIFRSQRDWYRLSRSDGEQNARWAALRQSNWRLNSQLIVSETCNQNNSVQDNVKIAKVISRINDLSRNLSDPPETVLVSN